MERTTDGKTDAAKVRERRSERRPHAFQAGGLTHGTPKDMEGRRFVVTQQGSHVNNGIYEAEIQQHVTGKQQRRPEWPKIPSQRVKGYQSQDPVRRFPRKCNQSTSCSDSSKRVPR